MKKAQGFISESSEWSFQLIEQFDDIIGTLADEEFNLNTYPNQIEIISAEQMLDAYSSSGMPIGYNHWSFGKHFVKANEHYQRGQMGLAYEIVINANPCIAYLMEENTMAMQALVIAHASYGHNSFFKNNYLFKTWTDASSIIDYLVFAKSYINKCEEMYGQNEVENLLDACHALMNYGVDRYKRPYPISAEEEQKRQKEREAFLQSQINILWKTIPIVAKEKNTEQTKSFLSEPQENILYFIEKNAPLLKPWQREIIRIVRKIAQYFYPQRQTQVMNEGWACFWHYTLMTRLHDLAYINDSYMLEILHSHTNVIFQPPFDHPNYNGINPYALGYAMMMDIKRICETPTNEDIKYFADIAGSPWQTTLNHAVESFKDESFIQQFLSPKLIRDFKFFTLLNDSNEKELSVEAIHNSEGYHSIREVLSRQYNLSMNEPNIQIVDVNLHGDRALYLTHRQENAQTLANCTNEVLKHLHSLWQFDIHLDSIDEKGKKTRYSFSANKSK